MYKYSCRKCPIRNRCIDESDNSIGAKVMVRHAFDARTDTLATWGLLQKNCLLLKAEKERSTSALSDRLQKVREAREEDEPVEEPPASSKKPSSVIRRLKPRPSKPAETDQLKRPSQPDYLQPVAAPPRKRPTRPLRRLTSVLQTDEGAEYYWLTFENSRRHIALPPDGGLVLGRFDPNVGIPPDIDLSFEDRNSHLISRRHVAIFGENGQHTIEDLGSKAGVLVNDISVGHSPQELQPGDQIRLGNIRLHYDKIPPGVLINAQNTKVRHILIVTPTGRKITLNPSKKTVIGRSDSQIDFVPDVDLSQDGQAARLVSRRHALMQWQNNQFMVEDLGSGFGTRLGGEVLLLGQATALKPGDHIWLAGCVLAYDIEL